MLEIVVVESRFIQMTRWLNRVLGRVGYKGRGGARVVAGSRVSGL